MWTQTLTDLAPAVVAIVVPWLAFRYALRREQRQWSREQRAQVYVDLLVESSAEHEWLLHTLALLTLLHMTCRPSRTTV